MRANQSVFFLFLINLIFSYSMHSFTPRVGLKISSSALTFTSDMTNALTTSTIQPSDSLLLNKEDFTIRFKTKNARTAIGFSSEPIETYLTPPYTKSNTIKYISFGGAGFIYPQCKKALKGYTNGDIVTAIIDFYECKVEFYVNSEYVGEDWWETHLYPQAYFSVSCEPGDVEISWSSQSYPK